MTSFNIAMVLIGFASGCCVTVTVCAFAWLPSKSKCLDLTQQVETLKTSMAKTILLMSDDSLSRLPALVKGKPNA